MERDRKQSDERRFEAANKISYADYDQPYLYWAGAHDTNGFFHTRSDLEGYCVDRNLPPPQWAWAVEGVGFLLDAEQILASAHQDNGESVRDFVEPAEVERLQILLDDWAMSCPVQSYQPDFALAVVLDPSYFDTLLGENETDSEASETAEEVEEGDEPDSDIDE